MLFTPVIELPRSTVALAAAVGIAFGIAYTLSPTTVVFLLVAPWLFVWAQRGLGPRERRWVLGALGLALLARVAAVAVFFLLADHFSQPYAVMNGDERFIVGRSLWTLNLALGRHVALPDYVWVFSPYGRSGLITALAYWELFVGPAPYGPHLFNIVMWLIGATALHRTVRRSFGKLPALVGFATVLFMPTLFFWSISKLKEAPYVCLMAVTIAATMTVIRGGPVFRRLGAAVIAALALMAIASVRPVGVTVAVGGLAFAAGAWLVTRRAWLATAAVVLLLAGGFWALRQPPVQSRLLSEANYAAVVHVGHVRSKGYSYKLLDRRFYGPIWNVAVFPVLEPAEAMRFAGRAVAGFVMVPLPWDIPSKPALALLPQQMAWYVMVGLGCVGMIAGWRRDAIFTLVLLGNILIGTATIALFNGNVGTLSRLRDTVVPQVIWFSALGGCVALEWAAGHFMKGSTHAHPR